MSLAPFPVDPVLTGIAIAYGNKALIADAVLPRIEPVLNRKLYKYNVWTKAEQFTVPSTAVGRRTSPAEVEFSAIENQGTIKDYGLDDPIPFDDIAQAPAGYDPESFAVQSLSGLIALDREQRVANLVFNTATYAAANKQDLSATHEWDDYTNSTPIADITTALDGVIMRPNTAVFGRAVFTKLSQHPQIVKAVLGNSGDSGIATRQQIAQLFELDQVLVGEGFINTAKRGQTAAYGRVWGKSAAFLYLNPLSVDNKMPSFGGTFQYGTRIAGSVPDDKIGARGGQRVRVVESVNEEITAADLGFYFYNAVS